MKSRSKKILLQCLILVCDDPIYTNDLTKFPKGSGKTLIACLLLRDTVDREIEDRNAGKQRRVSFFLVRGTHPCIFKDIAHLNVQVDNVTLVFQQAAVLECNLDAQIGKYCGAMGTDMWSKERWDEVLDRDQVRTFSK